MASKGRKVVILVTYWTGYSIGSGGSGGISAHPDTDGCHDQADYQGDRDFSGGALADSGSGPVEHRAANRFSLKIVDHDDYG